MNVVAGIDWGTKRHMVVAVGEAAEVLFEAEVGHVGDELMSACKRLQELAAGGYVRVGLERPRGVLVDLLLAHGFEVFAWNPKQTDRWRGAGSNSGAKDDRRDAAAIADALRCKPDFFRRVEADRPEVTALKDLVAAIDAKTRDMVTSKNRIGAALESLLPSLWRVLDLETVWARELVKLIVEAPVPCRIRRNRIAKAIKGARKIDVDGIVGLLQRDAATVTAATWPGAAVMAKAELLVLEQQRIAKTLLEAHRDQLMASWLESQPLEARRDIEIIKSMPGAGTNLVATLMAFAWRSVRERDREYLRCLGGAAPVTQATGGRGKPRRADVVQRRACNQHLREAFHHWGRVAVQRDKRSRERYAALRARGHTHGRALRQLTDGLLRVLCAALENGQPYDAHYAQAA